ncbi:hypothetical protein ACFLT8_06225 [Chloroflexota bacterium]
MTNNDLFQLYDSDLVLSLHNMNNLSDTRKILAKYKQHLNEFPPSPELAKGFLAQYSDRKSRMLYRYAQMINRSFFTRAISHIFEKLTTYRRVLYRFPRPSDTYRVDYT